MPQSAYTLLRSAATRLLSLWVKPEVLPGNPATLIDPALPVLYVMEVGGVADRAALDIVCARHGLPSPNQSLLFAGLTERSSVDTLRKRQGLLFRQHRHVISARMQRVVDASVRTNTATPASVGTEAADAWVNTSPHDARASELQIVPVAVYWGREPGKEASLWSLLYSENWQIAGRTRKFLTTLFHGRDTLLSISEPLSLNTLKASGEPANILERKLSRVLRVHFRQRRMATLGPDQSHRRMLIDHVLSDPLVRSAIDVEVREDGKPRERHRRRAEKYALEIAADISYPAVRLSHRLLTRLWNELYDGVQLDGIDRLKAVVDGREIVYVPCHRSHIDYLLLSYILYVHGFSLPHVAAGVNLNLPVVGGLLRRGGAFFLRRSFAGLPLYTAVFNTYLKEILQRGHSLEYFIEGGRSRTGRLLPPKGGMLAMTVHAYLREPETPVVFVPVYFGYERLLEGRAFTSELAGGKKRGESILGLLRSLRSLKENYGLVYVNIGEPIAVNTLLDSQHPAWRDEAIDDTRPDWLKPVITTLGNRIMRHINEAASVTPISLLSTAILATSHGRIGRRELEQQITVFQRLLQSAHRGSLVVVPDVTPETVIEHGVSLGYITVTPDGIGDLVALRPGQAAPLTYFRNNILHLLTLPALVASAFTNQSTRSSDELTKLIQLSFPFLQGELYMQAEFSGDLLEQALTGLTDSGLLRKTSGGWRRASAGSLEAVSLMRLAEVVMPAIERDYLCASMLARASDGEMTRDELSRRCKLAAERLAATQGRELADLFDKHLLGHFLDTLELHGFVQIEGDRLRAQPRMRAIESEARDLLGERVRHAILNAVLTTTTSRQNVA